MKKKGLIVATIVMVLVLAVSLTTATYAWFTNTGSAAVDDITFSVTAASDLVIGVSKDNSFKTGTLLWSNYVSDQTEYDKSAGTWTGTTEGLGLSINTGLSLTNMTKAVYSFTGVTESGDPAKITGATMDTYTKGAGTAVTAGFKPASTALMASGNGSTIVADSYEYAVKNEDYLDVVFAVAASKTDVLTFGCLISIDNTEAISALGMNAAIHVAYSTDGSTYTELDVYGAKTAGDANTSVAAPTAPTVEVGGKKITYVSKYTDGDAASFNYSTGDAQVWIPLRNATGANDYAATGAAGIVQLHLIIYICGPDSDCITAATGAAANISIEFLNTNSSMYTEAPAVGA